MTECQTPATSLSKILQPCLTFTLFNFGHPVHPTEPSAPPNSEFITLSNDRKIRVVHLNPKRRHDRLSEYKRASRTSLSETYWFTRWNKPLQNGICNCSFRRSNRFSTASQDTKSELDVSKVQSLFDTLKRDDPTQIDVHDSKLVNFSKSGGCHSSDSPVSSMLDWKTKDFHELHGKELQTDELRSEVLQSEELHSEKLQTKESHSKELQTGELRSEELQTGALELQTEDTKKKDLRVKLLNGLGVVTEDGDKTDVSQLRIVDVPTFVDRLVRATLFEAFQEYYIRKSLQSQLIGGRNASTAESQTFTLTSNSSLHIPDSVQHSPKLSSLTPISIEQISKSLVENTNSLLQTSNSLLRNSNSVLQNSNPVLQNSNSLLRNSNSVLQNSNSLLENSNSVLQNPNSILPNQNTIPQNSKAATTLRDSSDADVAAISKPEKGIDNPSYIKTEDEVDAVVMRRKSKSLNRVSITQSSGSAKANASKKVCAHGKSIHKTKPLIFLLHGIGSSADVWSNVMTTLQLKGFEVVAPDMLGHGYSSVPNQAKAYTFQNLLQNTVAIFDYYIAFRKCVVIGHSYGCALATALYKYRPAQIVQLVLISGGGPTPLASPVSDQEMAVLSCLEMFLNPIFFCGMKRSLFFSSRGKHFEKCDETPGVPDYVIKYISHGQKWPEGDAAYHRRIMVPTLLIHGLLDVKVTLVQECEMERTIPRAFLELIPNAGHMPMVETPEHLSHMILCFVDWWSR